MGCKQQLRSLFIYICINEILRNQKYIGDALLQKTYTTDFAIACVMFSQNLGFTYASLLPEGRTIKRNPLSYINRMP